MSSTKGWRGGGTSCGYQLLAQPGMAQLPTTCCCKGGGVGEEGGREKGGANEQLEASSIVGPLAYSLANRQLPPTAASGQSCLGADQWLRLP